MPTMETKINIPPVFAVSRQMTPVATLETFSLASDAWCLMYSTGWKLHRDIVPEELHVVEMFDSLCGTCFGFHVLCVWKQQNLANNTKIYE